MDRFTIVAVSIFLIFFFITYILHRFFKTKKFIKYLPSLVSLTSAAVNLILAKTTKGDGFRDLAHVLMSILLFIGFISGLISALYFDFVSGKYKK